VTAPYDALAPFYDLIAPGEDADVALYEAFARRLGGPVLELGVGTGRVAVALARAGLRVTGVDASEAMLARARDRAAAAGVTLTLVRAGLCDYRFDERFGLVFCAADTFLHLCEPAEQVAALRCAGAHLAPGGRVVLDLPSPTAEGWGDWEPGVRPLVLAWSGLGPTGGLLQHFVTFTADAARQRRRMTHILDETDATGRVRRTCVSFDLRFIFPGELPLLAAAAGLRLEALYGGHDLEPFVAGCARMIAVIAGG
jgi:SAM-dependent methyltransferase